MNRPPAALVACAVGAAVVLGAMACLPSALEIVAALVLLALLGFLVRSTAVRSAIVVDRRGHSLDEWALRLAIPVISLVTLESRVPIGMAAVLLAIATGVIATRARLGKLHMSGLRIALLVLVAVVAANRAPMAGGLAVLAICLTVAVVLLLTWSSKLTRIVMARAVLDSLGIYVVMSVVGYFILGLRSPGLTQRLSGFESTITLFGERAFFPFAFSLVIPGVLAAAFLCGAVPQFRGRGVWRRTWILTASTASVVVILATNYRLTLVLAVVMAWSASAIPRVVVRASIPLAIIALTIPLWWSGLGIPFKDLTTTLQESLPVLTRSEASVKDDPLEARTLIWAAGVRAFEKASVANKLFGFGANGQVASGAAREYESLLSGFLKDPSTAGSHNSFLQTLIDLGVAGVVLLLAAIAVALKRGGNGTPGDQQLVAAYVVAPMLVLVLSGATEATISPLGATETFWTLVLFMGVAAAGHRGGSRKGSRSDSRSLVACG